MELYNARSAPQLHPASIHKLVAELGTLSRGWRLRLAWGGRGVDDLAEEHSAEECRQRAADMKAQAQRAETVYLQMLYSSIADNWDRLAAQMQAADRAHENRSERTDDDLGDSGLRGSRTKH